MAIVQGETKQAISSALLEAQKNRIKPNPDYDYYPAEWVEPFKNRRFECGMALYKALGIGRENKDKRLEVALANYLFLVHQ